MLRTTAPISAKEEPTSSGASSGSTDDGGGGWGPLGPHNRLWLSGPSLQLWRPDHCGWFSEEEVEKVDLGVRMEVGWEQAHRRVGESIVLR